MTETTIEGFSQNLAVLLDQSQQERILVTRNGKPFAVIVGVANKDLEDLRLESSPDFWRMIEERRRSPSVHLADVEAELLAEDS